VITCIELTAGGERCRRRGDWIPMRPINLQPSWMCRQHALIAARRDRRRTIGHRDGRELLVADVPRPRRRFIMPTNAAQALHAFERARSLHEYSRVIIAVLDSDPAWVALGDIASPLLGAAHDARARLKAAASVEELEAYMGRTETTCTSG